MPANIFQGLTWSTVGVALLVFGLAPGIVLRLILLIYPRAHPRRRELLAELYAVPMIVRPFWVAQQLEVAFFEGVPDRWAARHRMSDRGRARALVIAVIGPLLGLTVFPLNWVAQALGLNLLSTWLVTAMLVVMSAAVMAAMKRSPGLRRLLIGVFGVACLALLLLRMEFIVTVAGDSIPVGLLQATLLVTIFAGLVFCGAVVLARIPPELPRKRDRRRG